MSSLDLSQKLQLVNDAFNIKTVTELNPNETYVQKYYKYNQLTYSLFYTKTGIIHMGISRDGSLKDSDLLEAARIVESYIKKLHATNILELATGRGGTSVWLAQKYPNNKFHGLDLSPGQLAYARKKARSLPNYLPVQGDFHDLSQYADNSMDIVFIIEALCYSSTKERVTTEVNRVLKKGGVFIILDGYLKKDSAKLSNDEKTAFKLMGLGMAVKEFRDNPSLIKISNETGFGVLSNEDVSPLILPSLYKFEKLAYRYFKYPLLTKLITKLIPIQITYNAISGLLLADLIKQNVAGYFITILEKI
ncbi:MAG: hypothetical protein NVSMB46_03690 [Candidatus Saccharimonadales bacterium]